MILEKGTIMVLQKSLELTMVFLNNIIIARGIEVDLTVTKILLCVISLHMNGEIDL